MESKIIETKNCGKIKVFLQGPRNAKIVILTLHDLGCNHTEITNFLANECMEQMTTRCSWVHVLIPGQADGEEDLPSNYTFPTMQQLGEAMGEICDSLGLAHVVLFGEGAGANILARMAMVREELVLGAVLIHCTGTSAGMAETIRDKLIGWKLNTFGMNPTAETYLILHRFGTVTDLQDEYELKKSLDSFRSSLRESINPRNLTKFILSFMARTNILEKVHLLKCPLLFLTGSRASHNHTVYRLYNAMLNAVRNDPERRKKVELIEFADVANVLRERPDKVADSLQYFIQGLGLASTVVNRRMSNTVTPNIRGRSLSMEEYDRPKGVTACVFDKHRKYSTAVPEVDPVEGE